MKCPHCRRPDHADGEVSCLLSALEELEHLDALRETNRTQALELLRIADAVGGRPSPSLFADVSDVVIERDRLREANENQRKTIVAIADAVGLPEHDRNLDKIESTVRIVVLARRGIAGRERDGLHEAIEILASALREIAEILKLERTDDPSKVVKAVQRLERECSATCAADEKLKRAIASVAFAVSAGPDASPSEVAHAVRERLERAESEVRRIVAVVENEQFKRHTIKVGDERAHGKAQGYRWAIDEVLRQIRNGADCDGDPCPVDEETIAAWARSFDGRSKALAWLLRRAVR